MLKQDQTGEMVIGSASKHKSQVAPYVLQLIPSDHFALSVMKKKSAWRKCLSRCNKKDTEEKVSEQQVVLPNNTDFQKSIVPNLLNVTKAVG